MLSLTSLNLNNNCLTEEIFNHNFFNSFPLLQVLKLNNNNIDNISNKLFYLIRLKEEINREEILFQRKYSQDSYQSDINVEINKLTFTVDLGSNPFEKKICEWLLCNRDMNKIDLNWLQGVIIDYISINELIGLNDFLSS